MNDISILPIFENKALVIIDAEDLERLSKFIWYVCGKNKSTVSRRIYGFKSEKHVPLGNEILKLSVYSNLVVDHKDRNPFHFRKLNLRPATYSQNQMNRSKGSGTSKYKGVCWDKKNNKWQAKLKFKRITYHMGRFEKEKDAALAYNNKAIELFKEFACLNKI